MVVSDGNPQAAGFAYAEDRLLASTYDVEGTVAVALDYHRHRYPIDGVLCVASDVPLTVARVAEALSLPGIPVVTAQLAMDKLAMKQRFAQAGVPIPWFQPVHSTRELRQVARERGYPLVLKPVDSRGARGVLRLMPEIDLDWAFELSRSFSPTGRVMVEEYLSGPQVSTESIVWDGEVWTPGFSDRNYEYLERFAPHIIENGGELPSHLPPEVQEAVRGVVKRAALAMGITRGVAKGDIVVTPEGPRVIEIAARLSGGYFCTHEIPLNTGVDFVGIAIRLALGEPPDPDALRPRFQRGVAQRYLFPEPGRVVRVSGVEGVASWEDIRLLRVYMKPGDVVGPICHHPSRAGVLIATGEGREQALARAIEAAAAIRIETEPLGDPSPHHQEGGAYPNRGAPLV